MLVDNCCSLFEELQRHHILCLISRSKEELRPEVKAPAISMQHFLVSPRISFFSIVYLLGGKQST